MSGSEAIARDRAPIAIRRQRRAGRAGRAGGACARAIGTVPPQEADVIVALGGDGFMLETLHRYRERGVPFYGMHRGSVGFLMNGYGARRARRAHRARAAGARSIRWR